VADNAGIREDQLDQPEAAAYPLGHGIYRAEASRVM
jgi:hypothetical protein